jgi:phytoene synthase
MTPDEYCKNKAASSGSSFYYSFLFLPPDRRRAITALYAFCREVDDVVDETEDPQVARTKLAWWRSEIGNLFAGKPQHPVTRALEPALQPFGITAVRLNEIIDGMQMDLDQSRYLDFKGLERYCYHVAGVVGLLAAGIFGYSNPGTAEYAKNLGLAFQLTNIIRDVGDDARRNRIYLPMDELKKFEVPASDILGARYSENFTRLMKFQASRAHQYYDAAFAALPAEDRRAQRAGLIMAGIYRTLLEEIAADGFKVLTQRTSLTPMRKLMIAVRTWLRT